VVARFSGLTIKHLQRLPALSPATPRHIHGTPNLSSAHFRHRPSDPRVAGLRHNETPRIVWRTSCDPMFKELLYVMLAEIEREGIDSKIPETEIESRGYARPCTDRRWKVGAAGHLGFPPSWIREILEMFAGGDLSLLAHLGRNRGAIGPEFERRPQHYECRAEGSSSRRFRATAQVRLRVRIRSRQPLALLALTREQRVRKSSGRRLVRRALAI